MPVQSSRSGVYGSERANTDEFAERRHVVKQRARELKRALLDSTAAPGPKRTARAYDGATRVVRFAQDQGGSFLRVCFALLCGAASMLVPIPSSCSLHGQLSALAQGHGTTGERAARVYAHPSECTRLSVHEPASVTVDTPAQEGWRFTARIVQLVPQLAGGVAACQVDLQLQASGEEAPLLQALPAQTALIAVVPTQSTSWLVAIADVAASDKRVAHVSSRLRGYGELAWQRSIGPAVREHWESFRQIVSADGQ